MHAASVGYGMGITGWKFLRVKSMAKAEYPIDRIYDHQAVVWPGEGWAPPGLLAHMNTSQPSYVKETVHMFSCAPKLWPHPAMRLMVMITVNNPKIL